MMIVNHEDGKCNECNRNAVRCNAEATSSNRFNSSAAWPRRSFTQRVYILLHIASLSEKRTTTLRSGKVVQLFLMHVTPERHF